jgi:hypothetical protein
MCALQVKATDFDIIEDLVLIVLADEFETADDEFVSLTRLRQRIPKFSANPIREAIRGLEAKGSLIYRTELRPAGLMGIGPQERQLKLEAYRATRSGIQTVVSFERAYANSLWDELVAQTELAEGSAIDRSDHWEPLQVDRSTPEFEEMTVSAERAIERIEGDNGYAAKEPEERSAVLRALKGAINAVKEGWPSKAVIRLSLLGPLRFLAEKFFGTGIGEAAKKAFDAACKWLLLS